MGHDDIAANPERTCHRVCCNPMKAVWGGTCLKAHTRLAYKSGRASKPCHAHEQQSARVAAGIPFAPAQTPVAPGGRTSATPQQPPHPPSNPQPPCYRTRCSCGHTGPPIPTTSPRPHQAMSNPAPPAAVAVVQVSIQLAAYKAELALQRCRQGIRLLPCRGRAGGTRLLPQHRPQPAPK